jgi:hypothetical protein
LPAGLLVLASLKKVYFECSAMFKHVLHKADCTAVGRIARLAPGIATLVQMALTRVPTSCDMLNHYWYEVIAHEGRYTALNSTKQ